MRVTDNSNYNTVRDSIYRSKEKMDSLQQQASTLKRVNHPSDDPAGTARILEIRTDKANQDQYLANAKMAETFLNNSDLALSEISEIVVRMKEIALGQSNSVTASPGIRQGLAEEVSQLFQQAVSLGNQRMGDRYLFAGFKTQSPPINPEGEYQGDDGQIMVEIANDVFLTMNIPGCDVFNTHPKSVSCQWLYGDAQDNVNLFEEIKNLRIALIRGDLEGIQDTLDPFDQIHSKLVATRAKIGTRTQGLRTANQTSERLLVAGAQLNANIEDSDMVQVMNDLSREETLFKNSLATSKRLIQPSLLDFLR